MCFFAFIHLFERGIKESVGEAMLRKPVNLGPSIQNVCEAITFERGGKGFYSINEGLNKDLHHYKRI
jgi:hypothetical protein